MNETSLTLRPWRFSDVAAVRSAFAVQDMSAQAGEPIIDDAGARRWIEWAMSLSATGSGAAFAVEEQSSQTAIANMAMSNVDKHGCAWVSYWTTPQSRGRGIASDALRAAVDFWHDELDIARLELGYRLNNPGSSRVAAAAGFRVEGRQRGKLCYDGVRYDVETAARLADDPRVPPLRGTDIVMTTELA